MPPLHPLHCVHFSPGLWRPKAATLASNEAEEAAAALASARRAAGDGVRCVMEAQEALSLRVELLSSKVDSLAGTPRQAGPGPGDN